MFLSDEIRFDICSISTWFSFAAEPNLLTVVFKSSRSETEVCSCLIIAPNSLSNLHWLVFLVRGDPQARLPDFPSVAENHDRIVPVKKKLCKNKY